MVCCLLGSGAGRSTFVRTGQDEWYYPKKRKVSPVADFNAEKYFRYSIGITAINDGKPETVVLSFSPMQGIIFVQNLYINPKGTEGWWQGIQNWIKGSNHPRINQCYSWLCRWSDCHQACITGEVNCSSLQNTLKNIATAPDVNRLRFRFGSFYLWKDSFLR